MTLIGKETESRLDERVAMIRAPDIAVADPMGKRPAKVLIVDDDPDTCQLISTLLGDCGYRVEVAFDGPDGLKKAEAIKPDLMILDVMMPGMDGWEVCRRVISNGDSPVLFLSARSDTESIATGLGLGAVDYVTKPFQPSVLRDRIANILEAERQSRAVESRVAPGTAQPDEVGKMPAFALNPPMLPTGAYEIIKRGVDLLAGVLGCIVVSLMSLPIGVLIKLDSTGPVFFRQIRIGKGGRPFTMWKFRSMRCDAPGYAQKGRTDVEAYATRIGRLLRGTLLDEFPQFLNVLRGEMSMVGPRPELPNIVAGYSPGERERLMVKPGITGWWQINGLKQPMSAYAYLDVEYVRRRSFALDLYILWKTLLQAVRQLILWDRKNLEIPIPDRSPTEAHAHIH